MQLIADNFSHFCGEKAFVKALGFAVQGGGQKCHGFKALHGVDETVDGLFFKEHTGFTVLDDVECAAFFVGNNRGSSGERFGMTGVRNFGPDRWLDEGEQVSIGDLAFDILHCPGHSPGSVVFYNKELRFAHVGDVLFNGSVGRTDLPGGSHATLIDSITRKLLPLGDDVGFICGHGPGSSIGHERMTNPFLTGEM